MVWKFEDAIPCLGTITEGPAWDGENLLFSNIAMSRVLSLSLTTFRLSTFAENTEEVNGLNFDANGTLFGCSGAGRRIVRFDKHGNMATVADRLGGRRLNSPNDLAIDPKGRLYFSDRINEIHPEMGIEHSSVISAERQADNTYRCTRRTFDTTMPNGLLFSKDYRTLYVAQSSYLASERRQLLAYPVRDDGSLGEAQMLHDFGPHRGIDGMTLSEEGLIVACTGWEISGPGGCITVFEPDGRIVETHPVPAKRPTNCAFAGSVLYVTTIEGHLLAAETDMKGCGLWPRGMN